MSFLAVLAEVLGVTLLVFVPYSRLLRRKPPMWQSSGVAALIGACYMAPLILLTGHPTLPLAIVLIISGLLGGALAEIFVLRPRSKRRRSLHRSQRHFP